MCAAIFPQKTTMPVCLGFFLHTSSMVCSIERVHHRYSNYLTIWQRWRGEVAWAHLWKTLGSAVRSITNIYSLLLSLASHLMSLVSCLLYQVFCIMFHVSCLTSPVSRLLSHVFCLMSPVFCIMSLISCLTHLLSHVSWLSHISCLTPSVSCMTSPVSHQLFNCFMSPVLRLLPLI